jgi:hypothetical protein
VGQGRGSRENKPPAPRRGGGNGDDGDNDEFVEEDNDWQPAAGHGTGDGNVDGNGDGNLEGNANANANPNAGNAIIANSELQEQVGVGGGGVRKTKMGQKLKYFCIRFHTKNYCFSANQIVILICFESCVVDNNCLKKSSHNQNYLPDILMVCGCEFLQLLFPDSAKFVLPLPGIRRVDTVGTAPLQSSLNWCTNILDVEEASGWPFCNGRVCQSLLQRNNRFNAS